jgi:hypothetical protein
MKRCPTLRSYAATIAAFLLVSLIAVSGIAQIQTGNIYGKAVAKQDGSALPGVTVMLSGVGAPQTFITDSEGNFRFLSLSPGTYQITADLSGFAKSVRNGIALNIGQNAQVTMSLAPSASESITVTAEAPLIDTRKTGTGEVISHVELEQIPTGRDPWVIMGQAAGVQLDRVNIGGSESGQQDIVVARGASDTQKTFNLDGVNITDVGSIGSTPTYYDFDSFEEIQITTGGSDPRIQTPGAQLNMVTKRGTNDFKGTAHYFDTDHAWEASPAATGEAAKYLLNGNEINHIANWSGDIGGPIWKDKIWFWASIARQDIKLFVGQPLGAVPNKDNTILKDWNGKLNFQPLANNSGTYLYTYGNKLKFGRYADAQHPPEATENQTGPTHMYKFEDTQVVNQSLYLTVLYSHVLSPFQFQPVGGIVQPFIDTDGVWHKSYFVYSTQRPQDSYRADGSYFFKTGKLDNELKYGFGHRRAPVTSYSLNAATGVLGDFSQGLALLTRPGRQNYVVNYGDFYVGDTITTGNLTIQGGARIDRQSGRNGANVIDQNSLVPDILKTVTISADTRTLQWNSVSPRIGFTYSPNTAKRTLIRGSYNRYVDQLAGNMIGAGNPYNYPNGLYYYWTDKNGDNIVQRSELGALYGGYGNIDPTNPNNNVSSARLDYHMKVPKTDEIILGFEREIASDLSFGVNFSHRKFSDFWWQVHEKTAGGNDFLTPADFGPALDSSGKPIMLTGTTPSGKSFSIPLLTQKVAAPFTVVTTRPGYTQTYNGFDIYATKRMTNHWMMRGNFSWNDRKQNVGSNGIEDPMNLLQPPSPITNNYFGCTNCSGAVALDKSYGTHTDTYINAKWQYNITSLYQLPWQFTVGANLTGRQGYPVPYYYRLGARRVLIQGVDDTRLPNEMDLDLRLAKEITIRRTGFTLAVEGFNMLNDRTVLQRNNRVFRALNTPNALSNAIEELQSPRIFRLSARMAF